MNQIDSSRARFVPELEALRGVAALMVALHHSLNAAATTPAFERGIIHLLCAGQPAVTMFFVLSGFVLGESLRRQSGSQNRVFESFVLRRLLRIYPAFLVTTLLIAPLFSCDSTRSWFSQTFPEAHPIFTILRNLLFIEATINMVTWTLKIEIVASILLPFFHAFTVCFKSLGLGLILVSLLYLAMFPSRLGRWPCFLLMFYVGYALPLAQNWMHRLWNSRRLYLSLLLSLAFITWIAIHIMADSNTAIEARGLANRLVLLVETGCSAVIVSALAYGSGTPLHRFLKLPVVRFFGMISFSFYLIHHAVLLVMENLVIAPVLGTNMDSLLRGLGAWLFTSTIASFFAWLLFEYVEKPGVAFGKKLTKSAA